MAKALYLDYQKCAGCRTVSMNSEAMSVPPCILYLDKIAKVKTEPARALNPIMR